MAILKDGSNEYEVRIKRYPDKTYFDEYIETEDREQPGANSCSRYIMGEDGVKYTIEITLKKGFKFGEFSQVQAQLVLSGKDDSVCHKDIYRPADYEDGIKTDITAELEYADATEEGCKLMGTRFAFESLSLDEKVVNETDHIEVYPDSPCRFQIRLIKYRWEIQRLTDEEYEAKISAARATPEDLDQSKPSGMAEHFKEQHIWDAQKADEVGLKEDGFVFIGGTPQIPEPPRQPLVNTHQYIQPKATWARPKAPAYVSRTIDVPVEGTVLYFTFYYRTPEFLEQAGIAKYPPPSYFNAWKDLDKHERQTVLKELQAINKKHVRNALEAMPGKVLSETSEGCGNYEPRKWRESSLMSACEKEDAFAETNRNTDDGELARKKEKARTLTEEIELEERLAKLRRERRVLLQEIDAAERKMQV
ncbi:hypothetical protein N431DRAFT_464480 [Stipitochalara longipes BDJ]|nr:hypothetical protein N431DRAFT_464480 [Stipitochalara longipes BDJ]